MSSTSTTDRAVSVTQLDRFTDIIDVRSPSEFEADHIPGARNCPVLDDAERAHVGIVYKQSAFEARKLGSLLIAQHISEWIKKDFIAYDRSWKPLLYCWRGGLRSAAMTIVLRQIGWQACQLKSGYKAYRQHVLASLDSLAQMLHLRVICGPTGTGKSRLLVALAKSGAQVLDLEKLASHRGSVLGFLPNIIQPTQRWFDSLLLQTLQGFNPAYPVFVESESRRIGKLSLPLTLYQRMHASPCVILSAPMKERVQFLLKEYDFYRNNPTSLIASLDHLSRVQSRETLHQWKILVHDKHFDQLITQLLDQHYDKLYWRSMYKHYPRLNATPTMLLPRLDESNMIKAATTLISSADRC